MVCSFRCIYRYIIYTDMYVYTHKTPTPFPWKWQLTVTTEAWTHPSIFYMESSGLKISVDVSFMVSLTRTFVRWSLPPASPAGWKAQVWQEVCQHPLLCVPSPWDSKQAGPAALSPSPCPRSLPKAATTSEKTSLAFGSGPSQVPWMQPSYAHRATLTLDTTAIAACFLHTCSRP